MSLQNMVGRDTEDEQEKSRKLGEREKKMRMVPICLIPKAFFHSITQIFPTQNWTNNLLLHTTHPNWPRCLLVPNSVV